MRRGARYYPKWISFYLLRQSAVDVDALETLLGSSTRKSLVEALALSERPLTPYRVAKEYNINVAKTYLEAKRLAAAGFLRRVRGSRGTEYELADDDLRQLTVRLSSRVMSLRRWRDEGERSSRFRAGLRRVPDFSIGTPTEGSLAKPTRLQGELEGLAALGRRKFARKYRQVGAREYARL